MRKNVESKSFDEDKSSIGLNIICFVGTILSGFGSYFLFPDWTGMTVIFWFIIVLLAGSQTAFWSDSRRVKMAGWSAVLGAICLFFLFFCVAVPYFSGN